MSSTDGVGHQARSSPRRSGGTTPSASTWWPCASTTSSLRRRAALLPRLHRHRQARPPACWPRCEGHRRGLPPGRLRPHRRRDRRAPRLLRAGRVRPRGFCVGVVDAPRSSTAGPAARRRGPRAGLLRPPLQRLLAGPGGLYGEGAPGRRWPRAPPPDEDLLHDDPRGPEGRAHQVDGPHHGRRLLRQHPPRDPERAGRPGRKGRLAGAGHFPTIQARGRVGEREMYRTFNMGIGWLSSRPRPTPT